MHNEFPRWVLDVCENAATESARLAPNVSAYLSAFTSLGVFFGPLYLLLGRAHNPALRPPAYSRQTRGQCYRNAGCLALDNPQLIYCEGYAVTARCPLPLHHAWCLTPDGCVVDNTWELDAGAEYVGVAFSSDFLAKHLASNRVWGVLAGDFLPTFVLDSPAAFLHPAYMPPEDRLAAYACLHSKKSAPER